MLQSALWYVLVPAAGLLVYIGILVAGKKLNVGGFSENIAHFMEYYKFYAIGIVLALLLIVSFSRQVLFPKKYDFTVMYATVGYTDREQFEEIKRVMEEHAFDANGDGVVNVKYIEINFFVGNSTQQSQSKVKLHGEFWDKSNLIFVFDKEVYDQAFGEEATECFENLSDRCGMSSLENPYIAPFSELSAFSGLDFEKCQDGLGLLLRDKNNADLKDEKAVKHYENAEKFFDSMMNK